MDDRPVDSASLLACLEADAIEHFWVAYHDYGGRAQAKTLPPESFRSAVNDGVVFALANLDMRADDLQAAGATMLGDSGDFLAVPDPRSYAMLSRYPGTAVCNAWMRATDGSVWDGCPRTRLEAAIDELGGLGYSVQVALEPEFYLLRPGGGDYQPVNTTRMFTRAGLATERVFIERVVDELRSMGVTVAQFGKEYGPGQYEMSVHHADPIRAVDNYVTLKDAVRDLARDQGYVATFMPKPYAHWAGNSLHVHLSIWNADGQQDLTASDQDDVSLSDVGSWFLGGILEHLDALTGLGSPTVNSYKRLQPGSWAPANT
jgi:glutamine synthetase